MRPIARAPRARKFHSCPIQQDPTVSKACSHFVGLEQHDVEVDSGSTARADRDMASMSFEKFGAKRSAVVCAALRSPVRRLGQTGRIGHDRPGTACYLLTALAHSFNVANSASRACLIRWAPLPDVTVDDSSERRCGWLQQSRATCADRYSTKHHLQPLPTAYRDGG